LASPPSPPSPDDLPAERSLGGRLILIVEDEAMIAMMARDALRAAGATTVWAGDGKAALAAFGTAPFDAAVVNLGLHDVNGAEVIRRFRVARPSLPVLVASGSVGKFISGPASIMADNAPTAIMEKPFDLDALVRVVADLISAAERAGGE
jgi:DNA-binding response OmpR family regulator